MAKIVITIEDTEDENALVSWTSDEPGGVLHSDGTSAEQVAYMTLRVLAKAANKELPVVSSDEAGECN